MGILDLHQMNRALLLKWWWKYKDPSYTNFWKEVIQANYLSNQNIPWSHFWSDVMSLEHLGTFSVSYIPGSQSKIKFWSDIWHQNCSLATRYPQLYSLCTTKNISIQAGFQSQGDLVMFRRTLSGILAQEWLEIYEYHREYLIYS